MENMNIFCPNYEYLIIKKKGILSKISNSELNDFSPKLLNIGNIKAYAESEDVIAAFFDLEGFTAFCTQVDPQLSIPLYLNEFLDWIFTQIIKESTSKRIKKEDKTLLWTDLPIYSKFLGDGILFIWRIKNREISEYAESISKNPYHCIQEFVTNIILILYEICNNYYEFYQSVLEKKYTNPPKKLRCGAARGLALSIGEGKDFVGPCINIASRLQKFHGLGFCVSARGIDINEGMNVGSGYRDYFSMKKIKIRGIGDEEFVYVDNDEFEEIEESDKEYFISL